jgi:hypothetical protein
MPPMAEATEDPPKRRRREHDWDAYGVVIASLVGLLAILVSGYTAYLQRKQVRAQVWPRVELSRNGGQGSIMATNNGIGPARVKGVRITVDGRAVKHWLELARLIGYEGQMIQSHISDRVMPSGTSIDMVMGEGGPDNQLVRDIADYMWARPNTGSAFSSVTARCLTSAGWPGPASWATCRSTRTKRSTTARSARMSASSSDGTGDGRNLRSNSLGETASSQQSTVMGKAAFSSRLSAGPGSSRARRVRVGTADQLAAASGAGAPSLAFSALRLATSSSRISSAALGFSTIQRQALSRPWAMRSPFQA